MNAARTLKSVPEPQAPPSSWDKPREVPVRHILGNAEVRKMVGNVTRHTLIRWRARENFPPPFKHLESGELWDGRQVREWLRTRGN